MANRAHCGKKSVPRKCVIAGGPLTKLTAPQKCIVAGGPLYIYVVELRSVSVTPSEISTPLQFLLPKRLFM